MKILLVGEYSNVHWTLAEGLRALGHEVTVVSDGDGWKNYPRDIDLSRSGRGGRWRYALRLAKEWPRLRGFDVVQLINPVFLHLKAERLWPFYRFLRRHNGRVFLGAFGIDHFWVRVGMDCTTFRYSDFNIGPERRDYPFMRTMIADWLDGPKGVLNQRIADDCDGIVAGLYEYEMCYRPFFDSKTRFIPFPIDRSTARLTATFGQPVEGPVRFFIGVQRERDAYKGTDILLHALQRLQADFGPERVEILKAENVPFAQYQQMMNSSHVLLDQLYSYTPGMNALQAMSQGLVVVGGGEEEQYALLGEPELRPIVNVQPTEADVYRQIADRLLAHPEAVPRLQADSVEYIRRHHDHIGVARQYEAFYQG